jgi:hypothetical protein
VIWAERSQTIMENLVVDLPLRNGNGADTISGRGLARRKLTAGQRVSLAADLASGQLHFTPSFAQICAAVGVTVVQLRAELKRRNVEIAEQEAEREADQCEAELVNSEADSLVALWKSSSVEAQAAAAQMLAFDLLCVAA